MKMIEQIELRSGLSPNKIWFTSDTHFFHDKVVEYSQRPFANVEEMNEEMIARWNSVVHQDGIVFHLGDFCFGKPDNWNYVVEPFVWSATNITTQMRESLISLFETYHARVRIVYLETDWQTQLERNRSRKAVVPQER